MVEVADAIFPRLNRLIAELPRALITRWRSAATVERLRSAKLDKRNAGLGNLRLIRDATICRPSPRRSFSPDDPHVRAAFSRLIVSFPF